MSDLAAIADVGEDSRPRPVATLRAAREAQGLSIADVARQLKLAPRQVEALETGEFAKLPGPVFVQGFIRNYAKLLQIDAAPLVAAALEQGPRAQPSAILPPDAGVPFPIERPRSQRWYLVAGALIAVAVPAILLFETTREPTRVAPAAKPQAATAQAPVSAGPSAQTEAQSSAPPQVQAPDSQGLMPGAAPGAPGLPAAAEPAAAPVAGAAAGGDPSVGTARSPAAPGRKGEVRMKFERNAWVEVRDAAGNRVFSQMNPAGSEQVVVATLPLSLVVGNAAHVRVTYNDKPVDLAPYTKVEVARFTLE